MRTNSVAALNALRCTKSRNYYSNREGKRLQNLYGAGRKDKQGVPSRSNYDFKYRISKPANFERIEEEEFYDETILENSYRDLKRQPELKCNIRFQNLKSRNPKEHAGVPEEFNFKYQPKSFVRYNKAPLDFRYQNKLRESKIDPSDSQDNDDDLPLPSAELNFCPPYRSHMEPVHENSQLITQLNQQLSKKHCLLNELLALKKRKESRMNCSDCCGISRCSVANSCCEDDIFGLREELIKTKLDYINQFDACKKLEGLITRMEKRHECKMGKSRGRFPSEPPIASPQALPPPPPPISTIPKPPPPLPPRPQVPPSPYDGDVSEFSSNCDGLLAEFNKYGNQMHRKTETINCLENDLGRLNRQAQLMYRNFDDIEKRYEKMANQYDALQGKVGTKQNEREKVLAKVPEAAFDGSVQQLMDKLETDLVNSEGTLNQQLEIDHERKDIAKLLTKPKHGRDYVSLPMQRHGGQQHTNINFSGAKRVTSKATIKKKQVLVPQKMRKSQIKKQPVKVSKYSQLWEKPVKSKQTVANTRQPHDLDSADKRKQLKKLVSEYELMTEEKHRRQVKAQVEEYKSQLERKFNQLL